MAILFTSKHFSELIEKAQKDFNIKKESIASYRLGQSYFNMLYDMNNELANKIRATSVDPYYQDSRINLFLQYLSILANSNNTYGNE